jgi:hypothetical protein
VTDLKGSNGKVWGSGVKNPAGHFSINSVSPDQYEAGGRSRIAAIRCK